VSHVLVCGDVLRDLEEVDEEQHEGPRQLQCGPSASYNHKRVLGKFGTVLVLQK
jgi:hypothetical protein